MQGARRTCPVTESLRAGAGRRMRVLTCGGSLSSRAGRRSGRGAGLAAGGWSGLGCAQVWDWIPGGGGRRRQSAERRAGCTAADTQARAARQHGMEQAAGIGAGMCTHTSTHGRTRSPACTCVCVRARQAAAGRQSNGCAVWRGAVALWLWPRMRCSARAAQSASFLERCRSLPAAGCSPRTPRLQGGGRRRRRATGTRPGARVRLPRAPQGKPGVGLSAPPTQ